MIPLTKNFLLTANRSGAQGRVGAEGSYERGAADTEQVELAGRRGRQSGRWSRIRKVEAEGTQEGEER